MKLSVASLAASDFRAAPRTPGAALSPNARPATASLYDDDEDVPTTLFAPRKRDTKVRGRTRATHA